MKCVSKSLLDNTIQHRIMYIWYWFVQNSKHFWIVGTESSIIVSSHYIDIDLCQLCIWICCLSHSCLSALSVRTGANVSSLWYDESTMFILEYTCPAYPPFDWSAHLCLNSKVPLDLVFTCLHTCCLPTYLPASISASIHVCVHPSMHLWTYLTGLLLCISLYIYLLFIYQSICPSIPSFFAFVAFSHCISWSVLINRIMLN